MLKFPYLIAFAIFYCLSATASESIPFNVKGLWYRGRIPESKIAFIDDINVAMDGNYRLEEIGADIETNGCLSPFVQLSVETMLQVFGPSRKIIIRQIEVSSTTKFDLGSEGCLYEWRGGSTGTVCHKSVCVSTKPLLN